MLVVDYFYCLAVALLVEHPVTLPVELPVALPAAPTVLVVLHMTNVQ